MSYLSENEAEALELIRQAQERYGKEFHMRLFQEECAEAIAAVNQYDRGRNPEFGTKSLAEEIADVLIMALAAREAVNSHLVDGYVAVKLRRLNDRLHKDSEHHGNFLKGL